MFFKVLLVGEHTNHDLGDGNYMIYPHTSSVSYLADGEYKILFDTGSFAYSQKLLDELKAIDVAPEDITHVCITHFHTDHTSNANMFPNAEVHLSYSMVDHKTGKAYIEPEKEKVLPLGIKCVPTPGHSPEHVAYFFEVDGVRYCVAGDAVREDNILEGGPGYYKDERKTEFLESAKMIFDNSDVIIPGHFKIIEGEFKKELREKLESLS